MNWESFGNNSAVLLIIIWEAFWKLIALWKSAKRGEKVWFAAIFLINLFGVVPLIYLWRTKQLEGVLKDFQNFFKSKLKKN